MRAIWLWLFKVSTRAFFALRIKQLWSNAYRALYESKYKDVIVLPVDTIDELAARLHPDWWKADGLKQLGDAVSSPQYVQAVLDGTAPKPESGYDCDEFAIYNTAVLSRSLGIGKILGGLIQANYMSVGWLQGWKPNGHAVCLLTWPKQDGGFEYSFMDYGQPSLRCASIREVCDQVLARYSPGADLVSGVVLTEKLEVVETVSP